MRLQTIKHATCVSSEGHQRSQVWVENKTFVQTRPAIMCFSRKTERGFCSPLELNALFGLGHVFSTLLRLEELVLGTFAAERLRIEQLLLIVLEHWKQGRPVFVLFWFVCFRFSFLLEDDLKRRQPRAGQGKGKRCLFAVYLFVSWNLNTLRGSRKRGKQRWEFCD